MLNSSAAARAQGIQWTRPFLIALCDEIRQALEAWAGEPDASAPDLDQARQAASRLAASLETLGVSGAAGLAAALGRALDSIEAPNQETATVLLESVAVFPDYLERLETGAPDLPEVLEGFVSRTLAAAGLEMAAVPADATGIDALNDDDSGDFPPLDAEALRRAYQRALRDWLKDSGDVAGLVEFTDALQLAPYLGLRRLGKISEAVFKGLAGGQLKPGPQVQAHLALLDQLLRRLSDEGDDYSVLAQADKVALTLLEDLQAAADGCPEIDRIVAATGGAETVDPAELERARSVLSGRNRELFTAIAEAARGELNQAKDALNEFLLGRQAEGAGINEQAGLLRSVSESFGMLGLERLKQRVRKQADRLGELTADPENPVLLDVARELLLVESELDEAVLYLGEAPESDLLEGDGQHLPKAEHRRVMRQLLGEALDDLGQAKHLLDQVHRSQADSDSVEQSMRILRRVAGVLYMAGQPVAAEMLEASASCIGDEMGAAATDDADSERLEGLAEALVVVDFYLDSLTRLDDRGGEYLHDARNRLIDLGYLGEPADAAEHEPEAEAEELPESPDTASTAVGDSDQAAEERAEKDDEAPLSIDFESSSDLPAPVGESIESPDDMPDAVEGLESDEKAIEDEKADHDAPEPATEALASAEPELEGGSALDGDDFDLMSIFLEEFDEELNSLSQRYPEWREQLNDQSLLTDIRRSFHTLKGSGRMAGAERIGEFAWEFEQLLNQTLDGQYSPEQVVDLVGDATRALPSLRARLVGETGDLDEADIDGLLLRVTRIGHETDLPELEGLDPTLVQLMVKEINDHLETIDHWIETGRRQGWPADVDRDLIRSVHTIKGTLRLAPIGDEAESMQLIEEYLQEVLDTDSDPAEPSVELMEDLRSLLSKRLDRLQKRAVSTDHFDTAQLAGQARSLISALHREVAHEDRAQVSSQDVGEGAKAGVDFAELEDQAGSETGEADAADELTAEAPEAEFPELEEAEAEVPGEEVAEAEALEQEFSESGAPETESPEAEIPEEEIPEEEIPEEEIPEEEIPEEEIPEEEIPEEEIPEEESPEEEIPERESAPTAGATVEFEEWPEAETADQVETEAIGVAAGVPAGMIEIDYDELDAELLELFIEEGQELLEHSDGLLQQWREDPEDRQLVTALQRDIHTVKGSARMAGLNPVGEVAHVLEDLLENIAGGRQQATAVSIDTLEAGCDHLHAMLDAVEKRQLLPARAELEALAAEEQELVEEAPSATRADLEEAGAERTGRSSTIRLASEQVEELLNFAGEVSIFRSRIEQEIGSFRGNIGEVEQTVTRLREQLRKLEQETEAQILSRYEREHGSSDSTFDPLELDRYSTIQQLSRALAESVSDLNSLTELMDDAGRQSETLLMQQARVNTELQEGLMQARMVSFNTLAPRLRRVVRNAARDLGRKANLEILLEGEGELDRNVLDRITAPIEHILRNAIAHGIEPSTERLAAGKSEAGTISITIDREATELLIRIVDDGAGLNLDRIRERALEMDLLTSEQANDPEQLSQIIFQTGFSTAAEVSELSGRGVGMDVVSSEVRQIGGRIAVTSEPGRGTRFTLRIPLSLAVMQAIFVYAGERLFSIPLQAVRGVARIRPAEWRDALDADGTYRYGGEDYPLIELDPQLGFETMEVGDESLSLLMISTGDERAAVRVAEIQGHREVVLKPVGPQISSIPGILGGTIMGDGQVIVLLDMAPLIERARNERLLPGMVEVEAVETSEEEVKRTPLVMVIDDSITMRRVTARILEHYGLEVITARDGVEAVDMLFERVPDLMLLDIEMPRMDGFELATYVRDDTRLSHVPIMMITSRSGDKHRQHAKELGVDRYLIKPYQETNMVRNVFEMLEMPVPGEED
ncbi:MAG TPA: Hpt domain-containing protein [Wenzhouxiangellaceae bacterium]|nr:Hpt domain-containing protein [Wenzhouxiangellaceae bacterium]